MTRSGTPRPRGLKSTPQVSKNAVELTKHLTLIDLTKIRFKIGCALILLAIVVFFVGHLLPLKQYFTTDFESHAWYLTIILLALGIAFSGKEIAESFVSVFKTISGKPS